MVIGELATQAARRYPDKKATVYKGQSQTFSEINSRANRLLDAFRKMGLKKGSKVSVYSRNNPRMLEILFAAAKGGITWVPINFRLAPAELKFVINDAEVDFLIVEDQFWDVAQGIRNDLNISKLISLGDEYEDMIVSGTPEEPPILTKPEDLFSLMYTSGTTGGPKGVLLSHENFMAGVINHTIAWRLGANDVFYHAMPFYHGMGLSMALCMFGVGGTGVIVDVFDGDEFWKLAEQEGITYSVGVYTMMIEIIRAYKEGGYSRGTFKSFACGGQTIPSATIRDSLETIGENSIFQVYGLTEVSPLVTCLQQEDIVLEGEASEHMASIGKELFFCHVRVVDNDDNDVKPGELGEIIAKGPNVSKGYWKRPKETEEAFQNGWIYTGDIGTVDKNGYIYHKDRRKDLIITGGENVSSYEVEDVIYKLPSVSMCAVIGVPHEKWGETVKAVVVLGEGQSVSEKEIIEHCITFLAKYKAPTSVSFADDLPKDETGKISKLKLRNEFGA